LVSFLLYQTFDFKIRPPGENIRLFKRKIIINIYWKCYVCFQTLIKENLQSDIESIMAFWRHSPLFYFFIKKKKKKKKTTSFFLESTKALCRWISSSAALCLLLRFPTEPLDPDPLHCRWTTGPPATPPRQSDLNHRRASEIVENWRKLLDLSLFDNPRTSMWVLWKPKTPDEPLAHPKPPRDCGGREEVEETLEDKRWRCQWVKLTDNFLRPHHASAYLWNRVKYFFPFLFFSTRIRCNKSERRYLLRKKGEEKEETKPITSFWCVLCDKFRTWTDNTVNY